MLRKKIIINKIKTKKLNQLNSFLKITKKYILSTSKMI